MGPLNTVRSSTSGKFPPASGDTSVAERQALDNAKYVFFNFRLRLFWQGIISALAG